MKNMPKHSDGTRFDKANAYLCLALLLVLSFAGVMSAQDQGNSGGSWKFAVSGDSRNCGDVVMPAIAQAVRREGAAFYWHLGDYRAIEMFDQDYRHTHPDATISDYFAAAWPDFIQHQVQPFGDLPVFLGIGNHELDAADDASAVRGAVRRLAR